MYANWNKKTVNLYKDDGSIIRRFITRADIVTAVVNGSGKDATVAITMNNGKTDLYRTDGTIIRRG